MKSQTMRYAAYGSNLHPLRLRDRAPSARLIGTGYLPHWSLGFHKRSLDDSGKCSIIAGSSGIHVAVFDLSPADKAALDVIEGLGSGYARISLQVPGFGVCESYVAQKSYVDAALNPYDWYRELVLLGARFHGFPKWYVDGIEATSSWRDPDQRRSAEMWATIDSMADNDRIATPAIQRSSTCEPRQSDLPVNQY